MATKRADETLAKITATGDADMRSRITNAIATLNEALANGHRFTDAETDACLKVATAKLNESERAWCEEIASTVLHLPLWHVVLGAWRRAHENQLAQSPVLDPSWVSDGAYNLDEGTCARAGCGKKFKPAHYGQQFCGNECGAIVDNENARLERAKKDGATFNVPSQVGTSLVADA